MPDQDHLLKTPLYQAHLDAGGKMVDFSGWSLPISYGSQIEEHHAVRQDAGVFDISHIQNVAVEGRDALAFLRYLLANDVNKITGQAGRALYSCMLNEDGGVIDDLIVYFFDQRHWRLVVNAACADRDIQWIEEQIQKGAFDVQTRRRADLAILAIQGPKACEKLWQVRPQWRAAADYPVFSSGFVEEDVMIARTGYTGEDGVEVILPAAQALALWQDLLAAGVKPCGLGARDTLRLEAALNLYGVDMDESTQPAEAGLSWTVSMADENRNFIGKQALSNHPRKQSFLGLKLNDRGVMRAGMVVKTAVGEGVVTSGTMSPTLGFSIAMARLPLGVKVGDPVEVEIRHKLLSATVVSLPFVRQGKVLI